MSCWNDIALLEDYCWIEIFKHQLNYYLPRSTYKLKRVVISEVGYFSGDVLLLFEMECFVYTISDDEAWFVLLLGNNRLLRCLNYWKIISQEKLVPLVTVRSCFAVQMYLNDFFLNTITAIFSQQNKSWYILNRIILVSMPFRCQFYHRNFQNSKAFVV